MTCVFFCGRASSDAVKRGKRREQVGRGAMRKDEERAREKENGSKKEARRVVVYLMFFPYVAGFECGPEYIFPATI